MLLYLKGSPSWKFVMKLKTRESPLCCCQHSQEKKKPQKLLCILNRKNMVLELYQRPNFQKGQSMWKLLNRRQNKNKEEGMGETVHLIKGDKLNYRSELFCLPLPVLGIKAGPALGTRWLSLLVPLENSTPINSTPIYTKDFSSFRVCTEGSTYSWAALIPSSTSLKADTKKKKKKVLSLVFLFLNPHLCSLHSAMGNRFSQP